MSKNDHSWLPEDHSWLKTTRHGATATALPFLGPDDVGHAGAGKFKN